MLTQITEYSPTEAALQELRLKYKDVQFDVTTRQGMAEAKRVHGELVTYRTDLERRRKEVKAPAWERCQLIDAEAKRITAELEALEKPIQVQIKSQLEKEAAERQAKIDAENNRRTTIQGKIQKFRMVAGAMVNKTSAEIKEVLARVEDASVTETDYQEFLPEAIEARKIAVGALVELMLQTQKKEDEQKQIEADRKELEALRNKQIEMQRQLDEKNAAEQRRLDQEENQRKMYQSRLEGLGDSALSSWLQSDPGDIVSEINRRTMHLISPEEFGPFTDEAIAKNEGVIASLKEVLTQVTNRQEQEAIQKAQEEEQARLNKERLELEQKQVEAKKREAQEAERSERLLNAKKGTPVEALIAIGNIAKESRLHDDLRWALLEIEIIAEANLPHIKPKRLRSATK